MTRTVDGPVPPARQTGAVACGHPLTRDAAVAMLSAGGNAFDAVAAGLWAACVAEPLLASPGGGGFLLARPVRGEALVYDFFAQTPRTKRPLDEIDFREILTDFGPAQQAFHVGLGSAATPGLVAGVFAFHEELGRLPAAEVIAPAVAAARAGVPVRRMQAYVASILTRIVGATQGARDVFMPGGRLIAEGDVHRQPDLAAFLEALGREGPDLMYRGEIASAVERACRDGGGHLSRTDFEAYRVVRRAPLVQSYRGRTMLTNPLPASGGVLVAHGLDVLRPLPPGADPGGEGEAKRVLSALAAMDRMRLSEPPAGNGTTHISVIDPHGGAAAATVSNGEGCGWVVPGGGFMLNNMLGESDLQPKGFGRWPPDVRLASMMAPTIVDDPASPRVVVLGSGGSNRIRSAILQVLVALIDFELPLSEAIARPRFHVEGARLEVEGGVAPEVAAALLPRWPDHRVWPDRNLFFGGVHAVERAPTGCTAAGDPRRGGAATVIPAQETP